MDLLTSVSSEDLPRFRGCRAFSCAGGCTGWAPRLRPRPHAPWCREQAARARQAARVRVWRVVLPTSGGAWHALSLTALSSGDRAQRSPRPLWIRSSSPLPYPSYARPKDRAKGGPPRQVAVAGVTLHGKPESAQMVSWRGLCVCRPKGGGATISFPSPSRTMADRATSAGGVWGSRPAGWSHYSGSRRFAVFRVVTARSDPWPFHPQNGACPTAERGGCLPGRVRSDVGARWHTREGCVPIPASSMQAHSVRQGHVLGYAYPLSPGSGV